MNLPEYTEDWSMDVILEGPDGLEASSDFVYDAAASGRSDLQICSFYLPGTYTIRATVSAYDYDYNNTTFDLAPSKFTLRKPRTQTTVKASTTNPSKGQVVRFNVVSKDERPKGYFPNDYADVILQALKGGKWVNVKGTKGYTNSSGRTVLKVRFAGKAVKVRARTLGDEYNTGSYSGTLTLR
ncbi:hypothetical protein AB0N29_01870 [Nocardioides sp. NPDC092400]|uniref:hypothetical protein n=1 Tax=Nocardioides sp. NPDC092400 TaxID=3155196 RepID=UPI003436654C